MSSCDASCSICCRRASCASATSVSSPTATAPLCCRFAVSCWAAQGERQLRRLNHLPKRLTHSGTARSAVEPCTWSNGSPLRNCCCALHRNQIGAPLEPLFPTSASTRASARRQILVSSRQKSTPASPSRRHICPRTPATLLRNAFRPAEFAQLSPSQVPLHPLRPIQST